MGTGELAVHQGMAGCLYALATALGLAVLAFYAPMLRRSGQSIWSRFDQTYGPSVSHSVALLSLIWMTGALATQIRGGSAVLVLTGMSDTAALLLMSGILLVLSMARLSWLSAGLGICMLACAGMLGNTLLETSGLGIWLHGPVLFAGSLQHSAFAHAAFSAATIVAMVICGADYQQFVIAASTPKAARTGCMLAAGCVFVAGFLPASAVIATQALWHLDNMDNPVQIVPMLLIHSLPDNISPALVIVTLIAAALGAGCAILRSMSDALATAQPRIFRHHIWSRILPVMLSSFVASRGQKSHRHDDRVEHGLSGGRWPAIAFKATTCATLRRGGKHLIGSRLRCRSGLLSTALDRHLGASRRHDCVFGVVFRTRSRRSDASPHSLLHR